MWHFPRYLVFQRTDIVKCASRTEHCRMEAPGPSPSFGHHQGSAFCHFLPHVCTPVGRHVYVGKCVRARTPASACGSCVCPPACVCIFCSRISSEASDATIRHASLYTRMSYQKGFLFKAPSSEATNPRFHPTSRPCCAAPIRAVCFHVTRIHAPWRVFSLQTPGSGWRARVSGKQGAQRPE